MESTTDCMKSCYRKHDKSRSLVRRHPVMSVGGAIVTAFVVAGMVSMIPDLVRYIRIKVM